VYTGVMFKRRELLSRIAVFLALVAAGIACLAYSATRISVPLHPRYDWLATAVPISQIVTCILAMVCMMSAVIWLLTNEHRTRTLIYAMCGALAGVLLAALFTTSPGGKLRGLEWGRAEAIVLLCVTAGATFVPLAVNWLKATASNDAGPDNQSRD
jgi:hypothetical protein